MAGGNVPSSLAPIFRAAGQQYHIPPAILAGVASVETNLGQNRSTSSTGAVGLMQFEPGTAQGLGVNPLNDRSAIFGAAKLLNQYGYQQNPLRAIGAYNGGPGNPQYGYANQVMSESHRLASQLGVAGSGGRSAASGQTASTAGVPQVALGPTSTTQTQFDRQGFQNAQHQFVLGQFLRNESKSNPWDAGSAKLPGFDTSNPILSYLPTSAPNQADYTSTRTIQTAQSSLQKLAGGTVLKAHPSLQSATPAPYAGGFLPKGATYVKQRADQGRDGQTNPGGAIVAPGNGYVVRVGSDPGGFGPAYPIVHFTSGPYAGRTMYLGHTLATITSGGFKAGQVLSHTGTHGVGNATVPGWFEIGFADGGTPGPMGQATPF